MENESGGKNDDMFFIEGSWSPGEEDYMSLFSSEQDAQLRRQDSPLTLSVTSSVSREDLEEEEDSEHQPVEEWMILGGEELEEDSNILLNVTYRDSSDEDSGDEDVESVADFWAVSDKDKFGAAQSAATRYFVPGRTSICFICNKAGHFAKNCSSQKKSPTCVLCGNQGHVQRDCPGRPCSICGLPPHGLGPCRAPPVWKQHCRRCGATGHLTDVCPDTWRQYHLTVKVEVPFMPRSAFSLKHKSHRSHCYNCSKRGHYGYECTKRRMISGTSPSLPYVSHYDTLQDFLQRETRSYKELVEAELPLSSDQKLLLDGTEDCDEKKGTRRKKQEAGGRRKTWPERRRERRAVKRLRREAQAEREGGRLRRSLINFEGDHVCLTHSLHPYGQFVSPSEKKSRVEKVGKQSRKSREVERWKKRGGIKRGHLHPHAEMDIGSKGLLSPKQRVHHCRR